jgi:hypothetical protein
MLMVVAPISMLCQIQLLAIAVAHQGGGQAAPIVAEHATHARWHPIPIVLSLLWHRRHGICRRRRCCGGCWLLADARWRLH